MRAFQRRSRTSRRDRRRSGAVNSSPNLGTPQPRVASLSQVSQPWAPIFPTSLRRRLRYASATSMNTTSGVPGHYLLRGNDLFDPDYTGTGHQPMGFDQMMVFYDHFVVTHSKLTATFINTATNNLFKVFLRLDGNNVVIPSTEDLSEMGGNIYDIITPSASTGCVKSLTLSLDVAKFHGQRSSALTATESLTGSATASPADGIYYHMSVFSPTGTTGSIVVQFVLDFEAIFFEPRSPSPSLSSLSSSMERVVRGNESRLLDKKKSELWKSETKQ